MKGIDIAELAWRLSLPASMLRHLDCPKFTRMEPACIGELCGVGAAHIEPLIGGR